MKHFCISTLLIFAQLASTKLNFVSAHKDKTDQLNQRDRPISALIVVDVQNDFVSGSLAVKDAEEIFHPINKLIHTVPFNYIYYSQDWHPQNHLSFIENVGLRNLSKNSPVKNAADARAGDTVIFDINGTDVEQKLYPRHCVQQSYGAQLDRRLTVIPPTPTRDSRSRIIKKGMNPDVDSFSVFFDNMRASETPLVNDIKAKGVTDVYVCGLAYDVCVGYSAMDSLRLGYKTMVIDDASRGIDEQETERTKREIVKMGGYIVKSREVKKMVEGRERG